MIQLVGSDEIRSDGQPETVETIAAQVAQYADRKRSDAAAARMKDQFVSTVSHELRTPLAAMDGWLHILLDGEPGPLNEEQHRFLTTVKRNSDRLMRLVGDLLLIGQMDAGRFTLDMTDVDVSELVSETVALFEGTATEKRIELTADMVPGAMVRGDRLRLGQLLSNLVSNAVKFTPEGGQVRVRVGEQGGTCVVEVTDSGIGIPAGRAVASVRAVLPGVHGDRHRRVRARAGDQQGHRRRARRHDPDRRLRRQRHQVRGGDPAPHGCGG